MKTRNDYKQTIPATALHTVFKNLPNTEVYTWQLDNGNHVVKAFTGRAHKPAMYYHYKSLESLQASVMAWIKGLEANVSKKLADSKHEIQAGDIFVASWGYEQTNIDYYQVTKVLGSFIELREIERDVLDNSGYMSGMCVPCSGKFKGEPIRKKVINGDYVKINSYCYAQLQKPEIVCGAKVYAPSNYTYYA